MKKIIFTFFIIFLSFSYISAQRQRNIPSQEDVKNLNKFERAFLSILNLYVDETNNNQIIEDAIKGMLEKLDPHSSYSDAEDTRRMNEPLEANFDGIGIHFNLLLDTLYIIQVFPGGPSEKVGLIPGDRIVKVDDILIAGVQMSNNDIIKLIRGKKGTSVNIKVKRDNKPDLLEFIIIRDNLPVNSIDATFMADDQTGYIRLSRFAATSLAEFRESFTKLQNQGMKNLILDLQENGGGYLHIGYIMANQFLEKGKIIVYMQGDKLGRQDIFATDDGIFTEGKLVILVNESSASASEILAGAVQDWDRGVIVGRRSFGKGLVQRAIDFPDSSMMRLTVARYYTPSGRNIQKPYEKGNLQAYRHDLYERFSKGELISADSIHFPDSLKFSTLVTKRTVYGGGGIMPDFFVPIDTSRNTDYHYSLNRYGLINRCSMSYLDQNRKDLLQKYPNIDVFKSSFTVQEGLMQQLHALAEENKIEYKDDQYNKSKDYIALQLKAYIARDLFDISAYFQIINDRNDSYLQALKIINDDNLYNRLLSGN